MRSMEYIYFSPLNFVSLDLALYTLKKVSSVEIDGGSGRQMCVRVSQPLGKSPLSRSVN